MNTAEIETIMMAKIKNQDLNNDMIKSTICKYDCPNDVEYVKNLMRLGQYWQNIDYVDKQKPMLYIFLLNHKNDNNEYILHIDCTNNLTKKINKLENEYQCELFFIGCKTLKTLKQCKKFNDQIKNKYPDLIESEYNTYKLSYLIITEFYTYKYNMGFALKKPYTKIDYRKIITLLKINHQHLMRYEQTLDAQKNELLNEFTRLTSH